MQHIAMCFVKVCSVISCHVFLGSGSALNTDSSKPTKQCHFKPFVIDKALAREENSLVFACSCLLFFLEHVTSLQHGPHGEQCTPGITVPE